jgi:hypothetical protein
VKNTLVPGAVFSITGERYRYLGQTYFGLKSQIEQLGRLPLSGGGSTLSVSPDEKGVMAVRVQTGCVGSRNYSLVFGILRNHHSVVDAVEDGKYTTLQQVRIPSRLGAGGVLVYGSLSSMPSDVVVRGIDGKLLAEENYGGLPTESCTNKVNGTSVTGVVG